MEKILILALDKNNLLGNKNKLPWNYPNDLKFFKKQTTNHAVIMGKNTYLSIGKPLKDRLNIIVSNTFKTSDDVIVTNSLDEAFFIADLFGFEKAFVIGGKVLFETAQNKVDKIILTRINKEFQGDIYFDIDLSNFKLTNSKIDGDLEFKEFKKL